MNYKSVHRFYFEEFIKPCVRVCRMTILCQACSARSLKVQRAGQTISVIREDEVHTVGAEFPGHKCRAARLTGVMMCSTPLLNIWKQRVRRLYREHAIKKNMFGISKDAKRWFVTDGIYTSCHDLITKVLQNDCDGDKALIVSDSTLVGAARRHMEGIVPLYYVMAKADAREITSSAIYESMILAYTGGNIGAISNDITKIFNSGNNVDLDAVKWLCLENNFTIDYAKTLFKPTRPEHIDPIIHQYTKSKVPFFFMEAKGKTEGQVALPTDSPVNRIRTILPHIKLNFDKQSLGKFDWRMLVSSDKIPNNEITQRIIDTYCRRTAHLNFKLDDESDRTNRHWVCQQICEDLLSLHPDKSFVVDVLVKHLFCKVKSRRKQVFWECFGQEVVVNLKKNVDQNAKMCVICGKRFYQEGRHQTMCRECSVKRRRMLEADRKRKARKVSAL